MLDVTQGNLNFRKCKKKPVTVLAVQINEDFIVDTLEGAIKGHTGDYLIEGVRGERYPIRKDIFEETYDWQ